jgi:putative peptidoglycan lipid II flippase
MRPTSLLPISLFGFLVAGFYRQGRFGLAENWLVYLVLCGYSTGILATTTSRLLQNTFYALGDTRSPARIAAMQWGPRYWWRSL